TAARANSAASKPSSPKSKEKDGKSAAKKDKTSPEQVGKAGKVTKSQSKSRSPKGSKEKPSKGSDAVEDRGGTDHEPEDQGADASHFEAEAGRNGADGTADPPRSKAVRSRPASAHPNKHSKKRKDQGEKSAAKRKADTNDDSAEMKKFLCPPSGAGGDAVEPRSVRSVSSLGEPSVGEQDSVAVKRARQELPGTKVGFSASKERREEDEALGIVEDVDSLSVSQQQSKIFEDVAGKTVLAASDSEEIVEDHGADLAALRVATDLGDSSHHDKVQTPAALAQSQQQEMDAASNAGSSASSGTHAVRHRNSFPNLRQDVPALELQNGKKPQRSQTMYALRRREDSDTEPGAG
ncbi:unnamed protein product, partial [Amoebophrya sp. A120]